MASLESAVRFLALWDMGVVYTLLPLLRRKLIWAPVPRSLVLFHALWALHPVLDPVDFLSESEVHLVNRPTDRPTGRRTDGQMGWFQSPELPQ
ncbi:hypothetical protein An03g04150 [Aspergillus niger]|uniref:Uncharacterized protein n=2 Tax=Aspergillus niger TaxID=5061 RepID=A2QGQ7_ASPNC|nr:hypothetical protein An03g04150 [Aspergillus niger]CAK47854.1 hypothetical protein An03g04150 [Aspergillus niger]